MIWSSGYLRFRFRCEQLFGEAPIHDLDFTKQPHHDVSWFQIAVDDSLRVGISHRLTYMPKDAEPARQLLFGIGTTFQERGQGTTFNQFHGKERPLIAEDAQLINGDDSWML